MGARIIELAEVRARRAGRTYEPIRIEDTAALTDRFHFWSGASGRRYVHTIYNLVECPALPQGNYILVHRDGRGQRTVLSVGRLTHDADSLNLAEIRHQGSRLGANEVHVHLLAGGTKQAKLVEHDLKSRQPAQAGAERASATWH
jgi:hypothetical protein